VAGRVGEFETLLRRAWALRGHLEEESTSARARQRRAVRRSASGGVRGAWSVTSRCGAA